MTVSMISQKHRQQLTWRRRALLAAAAALAAGTIFAEVVFSVEPTPSPGRMLPYDAKPRTASSTRLSDYIQKSSRRSVAGPQGTSKPAGVSLSDRASEGGSAASVSGDQAGKSLTAATKAPASVHLSSRRTAEAPMPPTPIPQEASEEAPALTARLTVDRRARPANSQEDGGTFAPKVARADGAESNSPASNTVAPIPAAESAESADTAEAGDTNDTSKSEPQPFPTAPRDTAMAEEEGEGEATADVGASGEGDQAPAEQEAMPESLDAGEDAKPSELPEESTGESVDAAAPAVESPSPKLAAPGFRPSPPVPRAAAASMFASPPSNSAGGAASNPTKRVLTVIGLREKSAEASNSAAETSDAVAEPTLAPPTRFATPSNLNAPASDEGAADEATNASPQARGLTLRSAQSFRPAGLVQPAAQEDGSASPTKTEDAPGAGDAADAEVAQPAAAERGGARQDGGPALSVASTPRLPGSALPGGTLRADEGRGGETAWRTLQDAAANAEETPFDVIEQTGEISVTMRRSKLLMLKREVLRIAIVDPNIVDVVQFTPREMSLVGKSVGATHVTFWFDDPNQRPITYLVTVEPDARVRAQLEEDYRKLEGMIAELFPDSLVRLVPMADKLIVKGQAKDAEEAAQILSLLRNQGGGGGGGRGGMGMTLAGGTATQLHNEDETGNASRPRIQIVNMLRVPGVHQIALRVKIAELNRTAARNFGIGVGGTANFTSNPQGSQLFVQSMLGLASGGAAGGGAAAPTFLAQFDGDDIRVGIRYMQKAGVLRLLSEPTLVTLSGQQATFVAGGEFAVPTLVGSVGLNAVTTDFRSFGAIISFMPTVVDKDRIRLQVAPEFSQINSGLTNGQTGTPGLNVRAVTTTVEMREGQTFAIAGLLEDTMKTGTGSDIPFLHKIFGAREVARTETELIILVTPELVHPMDPEEVPPLPGFDVTEPSNLQFYLKGDIEGTPTRDWRSPVWPRLRQRYNAGGSAMISGPFGHGQ